MSAFIDVVSTVLRPLDLPAKSARRGYERKIGDSVLFGTTDIKKVGSDFEGNQDLWKSLVSEAESTLSVIPTREQFKERLMPFLQREKEIMRSPRPDVASRFEPQVNERLSAAGLILPGSSTKTPITGKTVQQLQDDGTYKYKKVVDVDAQVQRLIQENKLEQAADVLYDQVQNIARLTPESLVTMARARGGESIFYPLRSARNKRWSELTGLPQRAIGRATSIGSANAGPYVEEFRTLALLPFLKVGKDGLVTFDLKAAKRSLGEDAFRGSKNSPGVLKQQADALVQILNDPDYLNTAATGLSNKTWVYDIMEADPKNPLVIVADNIGASGRTGVSYATLPGSFAQSVYGQIPERVVAQVLGIQPSALQEIDWLVSRILRGQPSSAVPFGKVITNADAERVAAGQLMHVPHSFNATPEDIESLSQEIARVTSKRPGGLVAQDVQDVSQAIASQWSPPKGDAKYAPSGLPSRSSVAAIVEPEERAIAKGRNVGRANAAIEAIRGLGPNAGVAAIAAIVAAAGFSSLGELFAASDLREPADQAALRGLSQPFPQRGLS